MAERSLKNKAISGVMWSGIERFSTQGVQFLIELLMARLLLPSDYGLIGMLAIFIAISRTLIDSGFSNALIQKTNCNQDDYSTVFYFNIIVASVVYAILYFSAPLIASFYNLPQLTSITRVFSISLLISSLAIVNRTQLVIKLDFRTQAKVSFSAAIISGAVGITSAYLGQGVWALVWQSLTNFTIQTILLFYFVRWIPSLRFSKASFNSMFSFGIKLMITNLLGTIYDNLYTLVIGKKFTATDLGYYSKSDQLVRFPTNNLAYIISRVSYPTLVNLKDDDEQLASAYRKFLILSSFVVFPLMIGFAVLARPFIIVLFTEKWAGMVLILQLLCIDWMWDPMCKINTNILLVKGKSGLILQLEIIKRIISVSILFGSLHFGLIAVCIGRIIYSLISVYINSFYTGKMIPSLSFWRQMIMVAPYVLISIAMGGTVYGVSTLIPSMLGQLILGTLVGIASYYIFARIFRLEALNELMTIIKLKLCKK